MERKRFFRKNSEVRNVPANLEVYKIILRPGRVALSVEPHSLHQKGQRFSPQSAHIPRLWVRPPVRKHTGANQQLLLPHTDVSLLPFFSLFVKINENMPSGED